MITWEIEIWEVRNDGTDPRMPKDEYPRVQKMKIAYRNERGQFHGATNYRQRSVVKRQVEPPRVRLALVK